MARPPFGFPGGPHQGETSFSDLRSFQVHAMEGASFFSAVRLLNSDILYLFVEGLKKDENIRRWSRIYFYICKEVLTFNSNVSKA